MADEPAWHPWKKIKLLYLSFAALIKLVSRGEGQTGLQFRQQTDSGYRNTGYQLWYCSGFEL